MPLFAEIVDFCMKFSNAQVFMLFNIAFDRREEVVKASINY